MRVLVTGSLGRIGRVVMQYLADEGCNLVSFDRAAAPPGAWEHISGNISDLYAVRRAIAGCEAVVHLAAIPGDMGVPEVIFETNVTGAWNVLQAASEVGASRFVFFSSVQATGMGGRGAESFRPQYLPMDDAHPVFPRPTYGLTKHVGEDMCESFTRRYAFSTYCLRPCFTASEDVYAYWARNKDRRFRNVIDHELMSYVDVRDTASAVACCLRDPVDGRHGRYLLAAADNMMGWNSRDFVREHYPDVPWVAGEDYFTRPDGSLVNTIALRRDVGWEPRHSWQDNTDVNTAKE